MSKAYNVEILDYKFVKDFLDTQYLDTLQFDQGENDIKYAPYGTIEVKIDNEEDYTQLPIRPTVMPSILN